jgi:hypothetical protein
MPGSGLQSQIRAPRRSRTYVRAVAVRSSSYLTNTCSVPRQRTSLRSARSMLYVWPARSCCSRTTTRSTGRSARTGAPAYRIRIERRCAEGAPNVAPAKCRRDGTRVCHRLAGPSTRRMELEAGARKASLRLISALKRVAMARASRSITEALRSHLVRRRAARRRPVYLKNRRRPTLPGPCGPSTIGAEGLNCSVRNGKRCFPLAKATGKR